MGKRSGRRKNKKNKKSNLPARSGGAAVVGLHDSRETVETAPSTATEFQLHIPERVYNKIMYWIQKSSPNEIAGFGSLSFDVEHRIFRVNDAMLLKQEVSSGDAEIDDNAINKAMYEQRNDPGALKWHWHSHPTFGVFWSGTDMNLIRQLGQQGWIVASVFNLKKEVRTAFLTSVDLMGKPHDVFVDDFKTIVERPAMTAAQLAAFDAEYEANVTSKWKSSYKPYEYPSEKKYAPPASRHIDGDDEYHGYERVGNVYLPKKKAIEKIPKSKYDKFGYATVEGKQIYNPLHDAEVMNDDVLYSMLSDMHPDEIDFLKERDDEFARIYREYMVSEAKEIPDHNEVEL